MVELWTEENLYVAFLWPIFDFIAGDYYVILHFEQKRTVSYLD